MPAALTFPGVYIEEIPSGVRTITGVATSITAFIGRTLSGETDKAVLVNGFADFERRFGGLCGFSPLSFAVRDFFLNGGGQALIVRLFQPSPPVVPAVNTKAQLRFATSPVILLEAANPGRWGENLRGLIDGNVTQPAADALGVNKTELFNLSIRDIATGASEMFRNLTLVESARRVDKVLASESALVRWAGSTPPPSTAGTPNVTTAVDDDVTAAEKAGVGLPAAKDAMKASDGTFLSFSANFAPVGAQANKKGLYALEQADLFNILCIPPYLAPAAGSDAMSGDVDASLVSEAAAYCERRRAFLLVDPLAAWTTKNAAKTGFTATGPDQVGTRSKSAAMFFPRLRMSNPFRDDRVEDFAPCGAVAGVMARTDGERGVWKAPAGLEAALRGVPELAVPLTDAENGELNPLGLNCLRTLPAAGRVVWGSRTLQGDDRLANTDWKYISVRRTALFIEESLYRGTQWVVFEPNAEPLWAQVRLNVGAFMHSLFLQGAFKGTTPREAYLVQCGPETTTADDINRGIVNIVVGFSPLRPAEFVVIKIQQLTQQIPT